MEDADALLVEYRRLWQVFMDTPNNRGPDAAPRQVVFDIERCESKLRALGIKDPFELVRMKEDDIEAMYDDEEPPEADMLIDEIPLAPF